MHECKMAFLTIFKSVSSFEMATYLIITYPNKVDKPMAQRLSV